MKRSLIILLPALLLLAACGAASQYASEAQRFQDGIYYRPLPVIELKSEEDFRELAAGQIASDTLRNRLKINNRPQEEEDYYSHPYDYRYRFHYSPYMYGSWYYNPYHFWGPFNTWGQYYYDPFYSLYWDPYYDPFWYGGSWYYPHYYSGYYGHYGRYDYYGGTPVRPSNNGIGSSYSHGIVEGGGNHRRAGSVAPGASSGYSVPANAPRRSGIPVKAYNPDSGPGAPSTTGSVRSARRAGGFTVSSSSPDYSGSSGISTRGGSDFSSSGGSYSGGSSSSSSSSSGGSSGGSYSGGSGGGGGGRR
ncbi:MAG: hypothetical protein J5695_01115 [Bacteroidales bacterium]|nr:hypothetical protein [Bacteroidales bacterium]MBO4565805.1 hypothetical protein [Bacteroidales bacterium]